jgi:hypothetical protein
VTVMVSPMLKHRLGDDAEGLRMGTAVFGAGRGCWEAPLEEVRSIIDQSGGLRNGLGLCG